MTVGMCSTGPPFSSAVVSSSSVMATSEAPKSTWWLVNRFTPSPDPVGW
jgi:hypothetical protein